MAGGIIAAVDILLDESPGTDPSPRPDSGDPKDTDPLPQTDSGNDKDTDPLPHVQDQIWPTRSTTHDIPTVEPFRGDGGRVGWCPITLEQIRISEKTAESLPENRQKQFR